MGLDVFARILATQYHVVRYDHRASGESSHPKDANMYKLERLADEMYERHPPHRRQETRPRFR